jgi:glycerol uptake facilitator-like aquaporin
VTLSRRISAEVLGSVLLTATVVGSGVMAQRLSGGNIAIALLANAAATVAVLGVLITLLASVSGAHFNPIVSLVMAIRRQLSWSDAGAYVLAQIAGCCAGAFLAHAMFGLPILQTSAHVRTGSAQWLAEFVASFGLLFVILGHRREQSVAWLVAAWIGAAYWFTASTSFANPAITIARSLSDTFAGIRPMDVPAFIGAQILGALAALVVASMLYRQKPIREHLPASAARSAAAE